MKVEIREREYHYESDFPEGWKYSRGDYFRFPVEVNSYKCFIKRFDRPTKDIPGWELLKELKGRYERNLPRIYDVITENEDDKNVLYVFHEFIEGQTLDSLISKKFEVKLTELTDDLFNALQAIHKRGFWYADFIEKNIFCDKSGRFFLIDLDSTQPESSVPDTDMWGSKEYWGLVFKYCTDVLHSTAIKPSHFNGISFNYLHAIFLILRLKIFSFDVEREYYSSEFFNHLPVYLNRASSSFKNLFDKNPAASNPIRSFLNPHALDDGGAISAAMIKSQRGGSQNTSLRPLTDNFLRYISTKEFRLGDGTLARNRPQSNSLWLDDLYMAVPALAQMGKLTGETKYFDDAVKQIQQFSERIFNKEKNVYMHGWVQGMQEHPQFHWARANGWAIMAMVELLDVLPENHPGRNSVLDQLKAHVKGLTAYQSGNGFWHQLLDRNDSYLETSATAIYTYCIAHAINKGWIDGVAYAPVAALGWAAVSTKVNDKGQVEGTCVGTGMGFDPAFYYCRPVNVYAAHGYGPVLLAGGEMIQLLKKNAFKINDSSLQFYNEK